MRNEVGSNGPKGKILVVDDERSMGEMIGKHLRIREFDFEVFVSPHYSLLRFREDDFDVVFSG